jgi:hypothetical protein
MSGSFGTRRIVHAIRIYGGISQAYGGRLTEQRIKGLVSDQSGFLMADALDPKRNHLPAALPDVDWGATPRRCPLIRRFALQQGLCSPTESWPKRLARHCCTVLQAVSRSKSRTTSISSTKPRIGSRLRVAGVSPSSVAEPTEFGAASCATVARELRDYDV